MRFRSVNRPVRAVTADTESWVEGSPAAVTISWIRPGDIPAVASWTVGPRPVGEGCCGAGASSSRAVRTSRSRSSPPQTRACSRRVSRACGRAATTAGSASSPAMSPSSSSYVAGSAATASASAVWSENRSSRSRARTTEARVPARVASCVRSVGTGVMRSGRLRRSLPSDTSSRPRSASARERGAGGLSSVLIRSTLAGHLSRRPRLSAAGRGRRLGHPLVRAVPSSDGVSQGTCPGGDFVGIESDQVVYEYLSRVGDVAQQRQLSSATRMRLVADLRNEIDKRRAKATVDSVSYTHL